MSNPFEGVGRVSMSHTFPESVTKNIPDDSKFLNDIEFLKLKQSLDLELMQKNLEVARCHRAMKDNGCDCFYTPYKLCKYCLRYCNARNELDVTNRIHEEKVIKPLVQEQMFKTTPPKIFLSDGMIPI